MSLDSAVGKPPIEAKRHRDSPFEDAPVAPWIKTNPNAPAVKREREEDWDKELAM
jgi:hypothetical protein